MPYKMNQNIMMKFKYLILIVIVVLPNVVFSKYIENYGLKIDYTSTNLKTKYSKDFHYRRSGLSIALFGECLFTNYLAIIAQIGYTQKGFIQEMDETNEMAELIQKVKANTRLDYLSLPLLLKISYVKKGYFSMGPRLDYLLNKKNGIFNFTNINIKSTTANHLSKYVLGGTIIIGFKLFQISFLKPSLEFCYNFDFTDSFSKFKKNTARNNSIDIGIKFNF
jgi:hypothetical protein